MKDAIARTLHAHPAFSGLSIEEARELSDRCEVVTLTEGNVLFAEGETADHIYVVLTGSLMVTCRWLQGFEVVVGDARGGSVVGEMGVLDDTPRSATLTARTRVEVLRIRGSVFHQLIESAHPAAWSLLRSIRRQLVSRLRMVDERVDAVFGDAFGEILEGEFQGVGDTVTAGSPLGDPPALHASLKRVWQATHWEGS